MADFKYEIVEEIGVLSENGRGWTKELESKVYRWNGGSTEVRSARLGAGP